MNPKTLNKIRALADDERGDPATRAAAIAKLAAWEEVQTLARAKAQHPGMRQSEDYRRWAADMMTSNLGFRPRRP